MKPTLRGHLHQAMFFVMLGLSVPLLLKAQSPKEFLSYFVYLTCALAMFAISTIYHRITWTPEKRAFWRKLDHSGIFLMIAGSFTPFAGLALGPKSSTTLLVTIWIVCTLGILKSLIFTSLPKIVNMLVYLGAGLISLPYLAELKNALGDQALYLILAGGVSYIVGGICYALKRPNFFPGVFGYHELFHLCVNLAALLHYLAIIKIT